MHLKNLTVLLLATPLLVACNNGNTKETITVTDMVGDVVSVPKNPQKVACVSRTTYDLLVAYGLGDKIDGAYSGTLNNKWVPVIYPDSVHHYVYGYNDSVETFLSRGVDLVLAPEQYIAKNLRDHGVPALCVCLYGTPSFDNYVTFFSNLVTKLWDGDDIKAKATTWNNKITSAIDEIKTELEEHGPLEKRKVFYVRGDKSKGVCYTDTVGSFTEYAYRVLGFDYVGSSFDTPTPSKEEVVASNPYAFVCGGIYQLNNINELKTDDTFKTMDAVKNNRVYNIPIGLTAFEQLSAMSPIFFYDQANKIYPDYFHYDIAKLTKETIQESFGTALTDEQITYMLNGLGPDGKPLV